MLKAEAQEFLDKVADDEPIFILRAQDVLSGRTVEYWADEAMLAEVPKLKIQEALQCAAAIRKWQSQNGCKVPD